MNSKSRTGITLSIPKSHSTPTLNGGSTTSSIITKTGITVTKKIVVPLVGLSDDALRMFQSLTEDEKRVEIDKLLSKTDENSRLSLAQIVNKCGLLSTEGAYIMTKALIFLDEPDTFHRECGLQLVVSFLKHIGRGVEVFLCPIFGKFINNSTDRSANVRDISSVVIKDFMEVVCPHTFKLILYPIIRASWTHEDWRIKVAGLLALKYIAPRASHQLTPSLPEIIPLMTECVLDAKKQVQTTAIEALVIACTNITNDDIRPLVPQLVSVIARPDESEKTLNMFLETTFVATVDAPVLALIAPLLGKSLKNRSSAVKRKAARVIDIMCRLVQSPSDVAPFVPLLLPALEKAIDELVEPEVLLRRTPCNNILS
jgi:elongation factor 3